MDYINRIDTFNTINALFVKLIDDIKALPAADVVERKKGKWIEVNIKGLDYVYCSECEDSYYPTPIDPSWYFCPHCGAKMEG